MDSLPSVSPLRYCSVQGFLTGPGTPPLTANISGAGGAPAVGAIFYLSRLAVFATDSAATIPKSLNILLTDGLNVIRAFTSVQVAPNGAATITNSARTVLDFDPPLPFMPLNASTAPQVKMVADASTGAVPATTTWGITGSGYWTTNPPGEMGSPTGIV